MYIKIIFNLLKLVLWTRKSKEALFLSYSKYLSQHKLSDMSKKENSRLQQLLKG